jgi:4-hydroxy-4-methyl-2-oxoglutarate aldolase
MGRIGAMESGVKPLHPAMRVAGRALTVDCAPADNLMIQYAVTIARAGDVLVVDAKGFAEAGAWGDLLSTYAQLVGIAGLVIDGAVRDSQQIVEMGFPVFTRAISIKGTGKNQPGSVNEAIVCAGVPVEPGDIVVGDADGVVVVPGGDLDRAVDLTAARQSKEDGLRSDLRNGTSLVDLLGLRDRLNSLGFADRQAVLPS